VRPDRPRERRERRERESVVEVRSAECGVRNAECGMRGERGERGAWGAAGFTTEHGTPRTNTSEHIWFSNDQLAMRFIEEIDFG
jgi:hypothetical protein